MKREVYICDTEGCGTVLLQPEDGFVLRGALFDAGVIPDRTTLLGDSLEGDTETALCRGCMVLVIDGEKKATETPPR